MMRIALPVPADAEFNVIGVVNPYGCGDPVDAFGLPPAVAVDKSAVHQHCDVGRMGVLHPDGYGADYLCDKPR